MTPFRFAHEFSGHKDRYWQLFFDEPAMRRQLDAGGMKSYEIEELSTEGDVWRRVVSATPARELPAVVRKVTGASLGYTETTIYRVADGVATTTVVPNTLGGRIEFVGEHRLEDIGDPSDGRFTRVFEGTVNVRIALVGGKIERLIVTDMESSYALGAKLTQESLSE